MATVALNKLTTKLKQCKKAENGSRGLLVVMIDEIRLHLRALICQSEPLRSYILSDVVKN